MRLLPALYALRNVFKRLWGWARSDKQTQRAVARIALVVAALAIVGVLFWSLA